MEEKFKKGWCEILGWRLGTRLDKDESAHSTDRSAFIIDETKWRRIFRNAWTLVVWACHVMLVDTAPAVALKNPSVQKSYFSLPNDLFTATLDWTVIRLLQVYCSLGSSDLLWKMDRFSEGSGELRYRVILYGALKTNIHHKTAWNKSQNITTDRRHNTKVKVTCKYVTITLMFSYFVMNLSQTCINIFGGFIVM